MADISNSIEEEVIDIVLEYFGYRIQPWEAEEVAQKIMEAINERLKFVLE